MLAQEQTDINQPLRLDLEQYTAAVRWEQESNLSFLRWSMINYQKHCMFLEAVFYGYCATLDSCQYKGD